MDATVMTMELENQDIYIDYDNLPKPGDIYLHYTGAKYIITGYATQFRDHHVASSGLLILFKKLNEPWDIVYTTPLTRFLGRHTNPNYAQLLQFVKTDDQPQTNTTRSPTVNNNFSPLLCTLL